MTDALRPATLAVDAALLETGSRRHALVAAFQAIAEDPVILMAFVQEHDREYSAHRGEPSPWRAYDEDPDPSWREERLAAARAGFLALSRLK